MAVTDGNHGKASNLPRMPASGNLNMIILRHCALAAAILAALLNVAAAPTTDASSAASTPQYVGTAPAISLASINTRLSSAELTAPKDHLVDNQTLLLRELDKLDDEADKLTRADVALHDLKADSAAVQSQQQQLQTAMNAIERMDCNKATSDFESSASDAFGAWMLVSNVAYKDGMDALLALGLSDFMKGGNSTIPLPQRCAALQGFWRDADKKARLIAFFDDTRKKLDDGSAFNATYHTQAQALVQKIRDRQAAIQDKLTTSSVQFKIGDSLWVIMLVIGAFAVAIFFAVTRFSPELQMEWVASGQVIQFVTVMIVLSVVMALGLSSILKEQTLGTLLGGIAGYVLAQGVGRAAARDAARNQQQTGGGQQGQTGGAQQGQTGGGQQGQTGRG